MVRVPVLITKDIANCSKANKRWGISGLHKDHKASTQMMSCVWTQGNTS